MLSIKEFIDSIAGIDMSKSIFTGSTGKEKRTHGELKRTHSRRTSGTKCFKCNGVTQAGGPSDQTVVEVVGREKKNESTNPPEIHA